jgi:hypothetical protein
LRESGCRAASYRLERGSHLDDRVVEIWRFCTEGLGGVLERLLHDGIIVEATGSELCQSVISHPSRFLNRR